MMEVGGNQQMANVVEKFFWMIVFRILIVVRAPTSAIVLADDPAFRCMPHGEFLKVSAIATKAREAKHRNCLRKRVAVIAVIE